MSREEVNIAQALRGIKRNGHPIYEAEDVIEKAVRTHGREVSETVMKNEGGITESGEC